MRIYIIFISIIFALISCTSSEFKGSSQKKTAQPQKTPASENASPVITNAPTPTIEPIVTPTPQPTETPDSVVGGQEVINDCARCVERAKTLSATIGFTADVQKTHNLGFYKIEPSKNLCDIHFMNNMSDRIADHEGKDSVLDGQIAIYCPCNCGWAVDDSDDDMD